MASLCLIFLLTITIISFCRSARILGVFPMAAHSHFKIGLTLMEELANRGHHITFIASYSPNVLHNNITTLVVDGISESIAEKILTELFENNFFTIDDIPVTEKIRTAYTMANAILDKTLASKEVQLLLESNTSFDLVILEDFMSPSLMAFSEIYKAPLVLVSTLQASAWNNEYFGNPCLPSFVPYILSSFNRQMSFSERFINSYYYLYDRFYKHMYFHPQQNEILHKHLPDFKLQVTDFMYNASLILLNSHPSVNDPVPHLPNMIEIGGFHVKSFNKELPPDIKRYLDDSTEGVLYFSMGSNLKSANMTEDKKQIFLKVFSKLKQKVLWKFEAHTQDRMPTNVLIKEWLPQELILAHPNIRLFISHGGLLSTIESIHFGVPILGIPIFSDQKMNMASAVASEYALSIPYKELTEDTFEKTVKELLYNEKYRKNAETRSRLIRDRLVPPMEEAVYWIEFAMKHKDVKHFRAASLNLGWYSVMGLDVALFALLLVFVVIYLLWWTCFKALKLIYYFWKHNYKPKSE